MLRFSELSPAWQALIRLCQRINHGYIEALDIVDGEPMFNPPPGVFVDIKLDHDDGQRPELGLADFDICQELKRLHKRVERIGKGRVARLEIRGGVPRRVTFHCSAPANLP